MGFTEMPTNNYLESSFWNFDALFQVLCYRVELAYEVFVYLSLNNILPEMLTTPSLYLTLPILNISHKSIWRKLRRFTAQGVLALR